MHMLRARSSCLRAKERYQNALRGPKKKLHDIFHPLAGLIQLPTVSMAESASSLNVTPRASVAWSEAVETSQILSDDVADIEESAKGVYTCMMQTITCNVVYD